jgi:hypothetical protein
MYQPPPAMLALPPEDLRTLADVLKKLLEAFTRAERADGQDSDVV